MGLSSKILLVFLALQIAWICSSAHAYSQEEMDKKIEREVNGLLPPEPSHVLSHKFMKHFLNTETGSHHMSRTKRRARNPKYNVVYLLDSSNSLGPRNFSIALNALRILTLKSRPGTLFAVITFSDTAEVSFTFTTRKKAFRKIGKIRFKAGKTNTQAAFDLARKVLFGNRTAGATPGSLGRLLIITDGLSNVHRNRTLFNAYRLKMTGPEVYVVAVGQYLYGLHELVGMASSTQQHLFRAQSMEGLEGAVKMIPEPGELIRKKLLDWQRARIGKNPSNLRITGLKVH